MWALATVPIAWIEPPDWVRVDDPDHPDAIARLATGALLEAPPEDGTPWRLASFPEPDQAVVDGVPINEAVAVTNADLWHAAGHTGAGVKVAVFDLGWFGPEADPDALGDFVSHDCFETPTCEPEFDVNRAHAPVEGGSHGWACGEIVRSLAPDAELHLVRVNTFTMLENAVDWAIREGIDVVTMSTSYYNESFYDGTGPHDPLQRRLADAGVLFVTSAGNNAEQHWDGPFLDADGDDRMDGDGDNGLWIYMSGPVTFYVNWNQFGPRCGETDLDAFVVDVADVRTVLGKSEDLQSPGQEDCLPHERFTVTPPRTDWFRLEVPLQRGSRGGLHVDVLSRGGAMFEATATRALTDPASHPLAVAAAAVKASSYFTGGPEPFSAWGPNHAGYPKPDIAAPDALSLHTSGPRGFSGTSAASPVVAGLVAVVMSSDEELSSRQAFERLQGWARTDRGTASSWDPAFGAGRARLPVLDPEPAACGHRPLVMPLFLWPFLFRRRR